MQKLVVEKGKCNACGMCTVDCDLLHEDAAGIVDVIPPGIVSDGELDKVTNIVSLCPTNALRLEKDNVDYKKRLAELMEEMNAPLKWNLPSKDQYRFDLDDKNSYIDELPKPYVDEEDRYNYNSYESAKSAGKQAFRDEVYSQADALVQQIIAMYQQRKINTVARYAEVNGNFKYDTHQRLIRKLKSYVNEIEGCTGKKFSLPSDFFRFYTKDTDYIVDMQDRPNNWLAGRIKENMESASEFYDSITIDKMDDVVRVSHWFGDDTWETKKKYAFSLSKAVERFNRSLTRTVWKSGKYTSQDAEREIEGFCREIEKEWQSKIEYLSKHMNDDAMPNKQRNMSSSMQSVESAKPHGMIIRYNTEAIKKFTEKGLSIEELKRILINSYGDHSYTCSGGKEKEYGGLWQFSEGNGGFYDEIYLREKFPKEIWNQSQRNLAIRLICHGRYTENDLVRIGAKKKTEFSFHGHREEVISGFALTKDSICNKGLGLADFIIPYGNIKEAKYDDGIISRLDLVFDIGNNQTGKLSFYVSSGEIDNYMMAQLDKYLNAVKTHYPKETNKILLIASPGSISHTPWLS